jgi:hypothetical protein
VSFCTVSRGGSITSIDYATALATGIPTLFLNGGTNPRADAILTNFFTGSVTDVNGNFVHTEACAGGVGAGCPASRPFPPPSTYTLGSNSVSASRTINSAGDFENYQGGASSLPSGNNQNVSLNVSRASGATTQFGASDTFTIASLPLIVAATQANPAGSAGTLVLTLTVNAPTVGGSTNDPNSILRWWGEFTFRAWLPTGNTATSQYQHDGVDLTTISGPTQRTYFIPITFGSAVNVALGQDVGIEWIAGVTGASAANGFVDPLASITGVQVLNGSSQIVPNFTLTDDAGDHFGAAGFIVPEPSTYLSVGGGLLALLLRRLKRARPVSVG